MPHSHSFSVDPTALWRILEFCRTHRKTDLTIRGPLQIPKSSREAKMAQQWKVWTGKSDCWEFESQLLHLLALCTSDSPLSFALVFLSVKQRCYLLHRVITRIKSVSAKLLEPCLMYSESFKCENNSNSDLSLYLTHGNSYLVPAMTVWITDLQFTINRYIWAGTQIYVEGMNDQMI